MNELLKTERDYIEDLRLFIEVYLKAYRMSGNLCPATLKDKEKGIFANIEQLYEFHFK